MLGQHVTRVRYQRYVASLDQLPEEAGPSGSNDVFGGIETRDLAKARQRSLSGPGAVACLRARPVDPARIIPASEFVSIGWRFLGMEEPLAARCPCCEATDVNTRHTRTCHRAGAQVTQHQPLAHSLFRTFKRLFIRHQVESGAPFNADRNLHMDMVIEGMPPGDAMSSEYRNPILLDVTHADPQTRVHMRDSSADRDGSAASTSEARKRTTTLV